MALAIIESYSGDKNEEGERHGKGKGELQDGSIYIGEWSHDKMEGVGDIKMAAAGGLLLGFPNIMVALTLAAAFGMVHGLVIWRHELPHGASPNTADRPRMVQYVNRYTPRTIVQRVWR